MTSFLMYGKPGCGYCDRAKALFDEQGIEYEYKDVTQPGILNELLLKNPEAATVPQIFADNTLIGGFNQLTEYYFKP